MINWIYSRLFFQYLAFELLLPVVASMRTNNVVLIANDDSKISLPQKEITFWGNLFFRFEKKNEVNFFPENIFSW